MPLIGQVSGSHTRLTDGSSHLIAGSNVTITTGSNGSVTVAASSGGSTDPAGSNTQVQFNNGGSFGADSDFFFVAANNLLNVPTVAAAGVIPASAFNAVAITSGTETLSPGSDTLLFVSGNFAGTHRSVFGGDAVVSGSLSVGSSVAGKPNSTGLDVYANVSGDFAAKIDNDQSSNGHVLKLLTDGNGSGTTMLELEDGDGDTLFKARADGRFGFGPSGVSSMGAGTFVVGIDGSHSADIAISKRLQHLGDSNTFMDFPQADAINFQAGGVEMLTMAEENNTGMVLFLSGGAGTDPDPMHANDVNFFVSGALDSKDTSVRGTAVFGGDLVVSGILYGGLDDETGSTFLELNAATTVISTKAGSQNAEPGTDTVLFVSGAVGKKGTAGTSVFGGDLVISGAIHGGHNSQIGGTVLELSSDNITLSSGDQDLAPGADASLFVSGAIGSQGGNTGGTAVFGGDLAVSGTQLPNALGFLSADAVTSDGETLDGNKTFHAIANQSGGAIATTLSNATSEGRIAIITNISTGGATTVAYTAADNSTVTKTLANGTKGLILISVFNGSGFRWIPLGDVT